MLFAAIFKTSKLKQQYCLFVVFFCSTLSLTMRLIVWHSIFIRYMIPYMLVDFPCGKEIETATFCQRRGRRKMNNLWNKIRKTKWQRLNCTFEMRSIKFIIIIFWIRVMRWENVYSAGVKMAMFYSLNERKVTTFDRHSKKSLRIETSFGLIFSKYSDNI